MPSDFVGSLSHSLEWPEFMIRRYLLAPRGGAYDAPPKRDRVQADEKGDGDARRCSRSIFRIRAVPPFPRCLLSLMIFRQTASTRSAYVASRNRSDLNSRREGRAYKCNKYRKRRVIFSREDCFSPGKKKIPFSAIKLKSAFAFRARNVHVRCRSEYRDMENTRCLC